MFFATKTQRRLTMTQEEIIRNCENLLDGKQQDPLYQKIGIRKLKLKKQILSIAASILLVANAFTYYENRLDEIEIIGTTNYNSYYEPEKVLSQHEFMDDLKDFTYIFDEGYIFANDAYYNGWDSSNFISLGFNYFLKKNNTAKDLFSYINSNISKYINDTHFSCNSDTQILGSRQKIVCFSDTYVKKSFGKYKVISSDKFEPGTRLKIKKENIFPVLYENKKAFRIGSLYDPSELYKRYNFIYNSYEKVSTSITIESRNNKSNLICTSVDNTYYDTEFYYSEGDDYIYLNIPECNVNASFYETMNDLAEKCFDKKNVIVDIRSNGGGILLFWTKFLYRLYTGNTSCNMEDIEINFANYLCPIVFTKESELINKYIKKLEEDEIKNDHNNLFSSMTSEFTFRESEMKFNCKFKGNFIILMNKNSASSAELFVRNAKKLFKKHCITIGSNTLGCLRTGNPYTYRLKNSGIILSVPACRFEKEFFTEGTGLFPDYWTDTAGMNMTLQTLIGNKDLIIEHPEEPVI